MNETERAAVAMADAQLASAGLPSYTALLRLLAACDIAPTHAMLLRSHRQTAGNAVENLIDKIAAP